MRLWIWIWMGNFTYVEPTVFKRALSFFHASNIMHKRDNVYYIRLKISKDQNCLIEVDIDHLIGLYRPYEIFVPSPLASAFRWTVFV